MDTPGFVGSLPGPLYPRAGGGNGRLRDRNSHRCAQQAMMDPRTEHLHPNPINGIRLQQIIDRLREGGTVVTKVKADQSGDTGAVKAWLRGFIQASAGGMPLPSGRTCGEIPHRFGPPDAEGDVRSSFRTHPRLFSGLPPR